MPKPSDRRSWLTQRFPPATRVAVPEASLRFATARCEHLHAHLSGAPLSHLLACAYLQGINDCAQAHVNNPQLCEEAARTRAALAGASDAAPASGSQEWL